MTLEDIVVVEAAVFHSVALEVTEEARRLVVVVTTVVKEEDSVEVEAVDLEEDSEEDLEAELEAVVEVVVPQFPPSQEQYQYPFPSLIQSP